MSKLKSRDRDAIMQALRAGVVPKRGLRHIQVGRTREIEELVKDMDRIADGGAAIRFIIGEYGSGKTFFLNLIRLVALEKGLVAMFADLAPDRRLQATGGQARNLYAEMARNLATRTMAGGGALKSVVERFVAGAHKDAAMRDMETGEAIRARLAHFEELTGGFAFAEVVRRYWEGHESGDEYLQSAALRWLRGEFATRTDARRDLGVRTIIGDSGIYDHLKLMAAFVQAAGYKGLLVGLDEMVNLFKLTSASARNANYEQILRILNDVLQGSAGHLGVLMGGTPEFLLNTRRGLYSYEALQSRLAENSFARDGLVDLSGPVIRLTCLAPEDLFVLLRNIRAVALEDSATLPDVAIEAFMTHCSQRIGEAYFRTPRNIVTAFVNLLAVLDQNPGAQWSDLIATTAIAGDDGSDMDEARMDEAAMDEAAGAPPSDDDGDRADSLTSFRL